MAHLFGMSEDTFLRCTDLVMDALIANLDKIISWPKKREFADVAHKFNDVGRFFPNVIGAIDDLHIEIELTEERRFEPSFINYKQFHSVHLQVRFIQQSTSNFHIILTTILYIVKNNCYLNIHVWLYCKVISNLMKSTYKIYTS